MLRDKEEMRLQNARQKAQVLVVLIINNSFAAEGLGSRCVSVAGYLLCVKTHKQ
jgi:hypothetical protein